METRCGLPLHKVLEAVNGAADHPLLSLRFPVTSRESFYLFSTVRLKCVSNLILIIAPAALTLGSTIALTTIFHLLSVQKSDRGGGLSAHPAVWSNYQRSGHDTKIYTFFRSYVV